MQHGSAGGKGVCMVFWNQQLGIARYTILAIVPAAVMGVRALWGTYHWTVREQISFPIDLYITLQITPHKQFVMAVCLRDRHL